MKRTNVPYEDTKLSRFTHYINGVFFDEYVSIDKQGNTCLNFNSYGEIDREFCGTLTLLNKGSALQIDIFYEDEDKKETKTFSSDKNKLSDITDFFTDTMKKHGFVLTWV